MKLALLSISISSWLTCSAALAVDVEPAVGLYYFTSDQEKIESAQLEKAEGSQVFRADRDPRSVARDLAREELGKGNVCLSQAQSDLRKALRSKLITRMCLEIFHDEIAAVQASVRQKKMKTDSLRCEASFEARETPGNLKLALSFSSRLMMSERLPVKLARAGFGQEPTGWVLPAHEASLGQSAGGWKEILKTKSCSLGESALQEHLEGFLEEIKSVKALAHCRRRLDDQVGRLRTLQDQLNRYVPSDWLTDMGSEGASLLKPLPASSNSMTIESCRESREAAGEQLEDLRKLSESLASKHDVPALNPEKLPGGRKPASDEQD